MLELDSVAGCRRRDIQQYDVGESVEEAWGVIGVLRLTPVDIVIDVENSKPCATNSHNIGYEAIVQCCGVRWVELIIQNIGVHRHKSQSGEVATSRQDIDHALGISRPQFGWNVTCKRHAVDHGGVVGVRQSHCIGESEYLANALEEDLTIQEWEGSISPVVANECQSFYPPQGLAQWSLGSAVKRRSKEARGGITSCKIEWRAR